MITFDISAETDTRSDMAWSLREIAKAIEEGYTSGITGLGVTWSIEGDETEEDGE